MIHIKRINELIGFVSEDKRFAEILSQHPDRVEEGKEMFLVNARLILENSDITNISGDEFIQVLFDFIDCTYNDDEFEETWQSRLYIVEHCPDLNTGKEFKTKTTRSVFKDIVKQYKTLNK